MKNETKLLIQVILSLLLLVSAIGSLITYAAVTSNKFDKECKVQDGVIFRSTYDRVCLKKDQVIFK